MVKSIDKRFDAKCGPKTDSNCIEWKATKMKTGYGFIRIGPASAGHILAHRYSYERTYGPVPKGMVVMHSCDNPSCVNPEHLRVGTHKENTTDMVCKNRHGWRVKTPWQKLDSNDAKSIRLLRQQGFTQQKIADQFNVSRPLISLILNGKINYSVQERGTQNC